MSSSTGGGLDQDQLGQSMAPTDIDQFLLVRFENLGREEVLKKAGDDCLQQKDITGVVEAFPEEGQTRLRLSDFQLIGYSVNPQEQFLEGMGTFLLNAYTENHAGVRMLGFVSPLESATSERVVIGNSTSSVEYTVDLDAGEPLPLDAQEIDWAGLAVPTPCGSFPLNKYDRLFIAEFAGVGLLELEENFLDLETMADAVWMADVDALSRYRLTDLVSTQGRRFEAFDEESIWVVALLCTTCNNPAPPFLAVVGSEDA